jgi:uncharacterized membrane protein
LSQGKSLAKASPMMVSLLLVAIFAVIFFNPRPGLTEWGRMMLIGAGEIVFGLKK